MKLAVIDIGSNSIKLLIAEATGGAEFRRLYAGKEPVRLGRETLRAGYLSDAAIKRAADTIDNFYVQARNAEVERTIAIATAAVREADNAGAFIEVVRRQTGIEVEVLSGIEEARLIGLAAWQAFGMQRGALVNIDIGGGSTEITYLKDGEAAQLFSVRVGAVRLTESFLTNDPPKRSELRRLREEVGGAFEGPAREMHAARWDIASGTSGTILAIGEVLRSRKSQSYEDTPVTMSFSTIGAANFNSAIIKLDDLERFNKRLAQMSLAERRNIAGISSQRAEIIISGGAILEEGMRAFGIRELRSSDWALREGVVVDRLREWEAERLPPVPDSLEPRLRSAHEVGEKFRYDAAHARHVAFLAERIFDQTGTLHGLTRHHRTLLAAAALLHDVGYSIAHESHHKHSQYIIRHAELTGFSEPERVIIALIARYHRGALPKDRHPEFAMLEQKSRQTVWRLGGILRLAEALDRHHDLRVQDVRCEIRDETKIRDQDKRAMHLYLHCETDCERERRAAQNSSAMFAESLGCLVFCHRAASLAIQH